jgi:hypothetical protein
MWLCTAVASIAFPQRLDDRIDLVGRENKIAGDCGLAATRRLEVN